MSDEFLLKFKVEVDDKDKLSEVFDGATEAAGRYSSRLKSILSGTGAAISSFAGKASSELNAFAGKEVGASLGAQARGVLQLRDAISALAVSSGKGNEIVGELKDQIQATSKASNQLQGDVTEALAAFVERTGDLETARRNIELYGKAATATGAAVKDLSLVGVELSDKLGIKDQAQAFAILATQSKAGAIELKDLATKGPRIFAAAASAGASGESGLREAGALAQVYAKGFGGSGTAASVSTAVENTFTDILKKSAKLEAAGVKVQGRDQFDVLKDIIVATGGDKQKLLEVFNARSIRGVDVLAREYRKTGGFATFDQFRDIKPVDGVLDKDFATRNATGEAALRRAQIDRQAWSEKYLGGIAEFGAQHANELQIGLTGAGLLGKGLSLAGRIGNTVGGRVGGALGAAGATQVYVTNWPGGGFGDGPGGAPGKLGKVVDGATQFLGAAAIGVAIGAELGNYLDKHSKTAAGFYSKEADLIDWLGGSKGKRKSLEDAGVSLHRTRLQAAKEEREGLIHDFESTGMSHGKAVYAADQKLQAEIKNLQITINDSGATAQTDDGTRAPAVMVKRGAGGGN